MRFENKTILVIGDVMLDHYISGKAARISPEAPVPVVSRQSAWMVPGGAANVARGVARLGCQARLIGLAADDNPGHALSQKIAAEGVEALLVPGRNRPTICKIRILAGGQQLLRLDEETIARPSLPERVGLARALEKLFPGCNAVILSDYGKGVLLPDNDGRSLCETVIRMAKAAAVPVLVDPKGTDWSRYAGADCITPNTGEFQQICQAVFGESPATVADIAAFAARLGRKFNLGRILLTRGREGMILFEEGRQPLKIFTAAREVADVSGAGDTVIATLAACAASDLPWPEATRLANTAAGIAVGKLGAAPVDIQELNFALEKDSATAKIYRLPRLLETVEAWRRDGKKIVFTNGCFDLIHPGHIALLREAAAQGDKLIVGLNSDSSVSRLKGPERPIQKENSRARVLAALADVDGVTIFGEDTPEELIKAVRPDVLVKGGDYRLEDVVGAPFVQSYGGSVHLANLVSGQSTSGIVESLKR